MRRRLYFLLPDLESARRTADDLLLARVDDRHMRFLARRGSDLGDLHEANYLQKTDMTHGASVGFALGGLGEGLRCDHRRPGHGAPDAAQRLINFAVFLLGINLDEAD